MLSKIYMILIKIPCNKFITKFLSCITPIVHISNSRIRSEVADIIRIIGVVKYDLCAFFYMSALLTSKFVTEACAAHVKPLSNDTLHIIRSDMFRNKCSIFSFN